MITTVGTEFMANAIFSRNWDSPGYINKIGLGSGLTAESYADTALATAYTDHGFEQQTVEATYSTNKLTFTNTFTNGATTERTINEVGLFSSTGVLIYRHVFITNELSNFGIVPPGADISITITLTGTSKNFSGELSIIPTDIGVAEIGFYINITAATTSVFDPSDFPTPAPICYNGIEFPSAGIPRFSEALGAKSWEFTCYTEDYTLINTILRYAGPLTTGNSITGKQYVLSSYRAGVLAIKNMTTHTHDLYSNCYIQGPISPEPFGNGWWFDVKVIQSAYSEA